MLAAHGELPRQSTGCSGTRSTAGPIKGARCIAVASRLPAVDVARGVPARLQGAHHACQRCCIHFADHLGTAEAPTQSSVRRNAKRSALHALRQLTNGAWGYACLWQSSANACPQCAVRNRPLGRGDRPRRLCGEWLCASRADHVRFFRQSNPRFILVSCSDDTTIRVWDTTTADCLFKFEVGAGHSATTQAQPVSTAVDAPPTSPSCA